MIYQNCLPVYHPRIEDQMGKVNNERNMMAKKIALPITDISFTETKRESGFRRK